ncbi:hypothetical protein GGS26DRAFT_588426 [Hypomontagnella submonticulosa]|nr:hypothetical protein GGS26DRAFT_588426 [Hypomontagnella submonticulosa]
MSYTQDKAHSSAMLSAIQDGEKAQQQSQPSATTSSDSASIFSTSSFGSMKALLKKGKSSKSSEDKAPTEAELLRKAQQNQGK